MTNFSRLTDLLSANGLEFVVGGGLAVMMHGSAMQTQDVDVVCSMDKKNLHLLFKALEDLHPVHRMTPQRLPFTRMQIEDGNIKNLYLSTDWGQLDCLGEIKGIGDYAACLARSVGVRLGDMKIRVLDLDAMIDAKRAMKRPRDLHAVLELEAIREKLRSRP
jgi:hypothetical protein